VGIIAPDKPAKDRFQGGYDTRDCRNLGRSEPRADDCNASLAAKGYIRRRCLLLTRKPPFGLPWRRPRIGREVPEVGVELDLSDINIALDANFQNKLIAKERL